MSANVVFVVTATGVVRAVCDTAEGARAVARQCAGFVQAWPVLDKLTLP
jgi:hypothetical protein